MPNTTSTSVLANADAPDACETTFLCDLKGICTYISPDVQHLRGYRPDELVGQSLYLHLPDESVLLLREMLAEGIDLMMMESQGAPVTFEDKVEYQVGCSNGSLRWVETRLTLLRDHAGNASGFLGVCRAVTPAE